MNALTKLIAASAATLTIAVGGAAVHAATSTPPRPSDVLPNWCENFTQDRRPEGARNWAPTEAQTPAADGLTKMARGLTVNRWLPDPQGNPTATVGIFSDDAIGGGRGWGIWPQPHDAINNRSVTRVDIGYWNCDGQHPWRNWGGQQPNDPRAATFWIVKGQEPRYVDLTDIYAGGFNARPKSDAPARFTDQFQYRYWTDRGWSNVGTVTIAR